MGLGSLTMLFGVLIFPDYLSFSPISGKEEEDTGYIFLQGVFHRDRNIAKLYQPSTISIN